MPKARISFEYNDKTGKRDIHIDYESDPSALPYEHEDEHSDLVNRILDVKSIRESKDQDVVVTREQPKAEPESNQSEPKERTRLQARIRSEK